MTKEQIEKKAKEEFPDEPLRSDEYTRKMRQSFLELFRKCFIQGAEFALSHQWVSVEDELPKNSETVLIRNKNGGIARATYGTVGRFDTGNVINDVYAWILIDVGVRIGDSDVTHWIPIPPIAEEGGEKK